MQGACRNPHGFGFAVIVGDSIISERGMSAKRVTNRFLEVRREFPDSYAMWHARIATHGVRNETNCHPFQVGDGGLTYLAHNGILDVPMDKDDKRSDSRVFAEETLPKMGGVHALDDDVIYTMVASWAKGNKICVLTVDPVAEADCYLINEKLGTWDKEGVWWSNTYHRPTVLKPGGGDYYAGYGNRTMISVPANPVTVEVTKDFWYPCGVCQGENNLLEGEDYCIFCGACLDCEVSMDECMCYKGPADRVGSLRAIALGEEEEYLRELNGSNHTGWGRVLDY